ncbi:20572_t:CDS:1, partial [Dentiscutata erythropus]
EDNTNANSLFTPYQICKYCNKDVVGLVDHLKEYLNKYNSFPYKLQGLTNLTTSKARRNSAPMQPNSTAIQSRQM